MIPVPGAGSARAVAAACAHCGLDVPAALCRADAPEQFCCNGCRQVHALLREWGFDHYYQLVDRQAGVLAPARVSGRSFEDFDDARLQDEATDALSPERRRTRLYLEGVHCSACVWLVEKLPAVLPGVDEVRLNYGSAVAEVTWRPGHTRLSTVARALDRLGYTPHVHRASRAHEARREEDRVMLARLGVAAAGAMNLMFISGALYAGEHSGMASAYEGFFRWLSLLIAVPVLGFSARPFFQTALAGLRTRVVHIDLPIAVAIAIAAAASSWNALWGSGRCGSTRSPCWWRRCWVRGNCSAALSAPRSSAPTACAVWRSSSLPGGSKATATMRRWWRCRSRRWCRATASRSARANLFRLTAWCSRARPRSTTLCSPARPCRCRSPRATR